MRKRKEKYRVYAARDLSKVRKSARSTPRGSELGMSRLYYHLSLRGLPTLWSGPAILAHLF
jgi:hypothetical protein